MSERSAERWYGAVHGETTEAIADFDDRIGAEAVTQPATGETRNLRSVLDLVPDDADSVVLLGFPVHQFLSDPTGSRARIT